MEGILQRAVEMKASDIHFEPRAECLQVRIRIDGLLQPLEQLPLTHRHAITTRLKVLADIDISEQRLPQDGHFQLLLRHAQRDCRISTCPTQYGEKTVVRILYDTHEKRDIASLGMTTKQMRCFSKHLAQTKGLIIVTGPTGSGKTMTLYTALDQLNTATRNISSIEDPVEMKIPGINQVPINRKAGLDFSVALRAFLRQDPDIIMIGEIRDEETASMAIRAAQTGHLVLTTLHTNSAAEAVTRLINMGILPYNLAEALSLVIAQRLVRIRHKTGYAGRTGVYELLSVHDEMRSLILNGAPASQIQAANRADATLYDNAMQKVHAGITDQAEVYRVL